MRIRKVEEKDVSEIAALFYSTIRKVNSKDYSSAQINAWAPEIKDNESWKSRWSDCHVIVAESNGQILGFTELRPTGLIDCFYVHHQVQRKGVGKAMIEEAFKIAKSEGLNSLIADVSITAKPFFKSMGFEVVEEKFRDLGGERFVQFLMRWGESSSNLVTSSIS